MRHATASEQHIFAHRNPAKTHTAHLLELRVRKQRTRSSRRACEQHTRSSREPASVRTAHPLEPRACERANSAPARAASLQACEQRREREQARKKEIPTTMAFLNTPAERPIAHLLLAHGAGAPMDSPFMNQMAEQLAKSRIGVTRFEFAYMAARRDTGKRAPAPRAEKLLDAYRATIDAVVNDLPDETPLMIGGKSLGGRVASMIAVEQWESDMIAGLVCLGYPFHPSGKPDKLRIAHLEGFDCPALIVQGTRDPLGTLDDVATYPLDKRINIHWLIDGDHDLKPRKSSGFSHEQHLSEASRAIASFAQKLCKVA